MRFVDAVENTVAFLAANPHVGQIYLPSNPLIPLLRIWPIDGFRNQLIFFHATDATVEIVRVVHGARDLDSIFNQ
jgi:toxin ParE1/3/4